MTDELTEISTGTDSEELKKRQRILDQRSGDALKEKWRGDDRNALERAIAAAAPPIVNEPKCHVCQSPHRLWIERQLLQGRAYLAIERSMPNGPDRRSISNHYKNHMALDQAAVRALLEEEADLVHQNYEEGVKGAITHRGMLEVLARKAYQDAMDNLTTVEPRDMIQILRALNDLNEGSGTAAVEEAKMAINIFKTALQDVLLKGEGGDIVTREVGSQLLVAIGHRIELLREEADIQSAIERQLLPPGKNEGV